MPVVITAFYAAILALIVTALAANVTFHRVKLGVSLGDGGKPQMLRMIRIHANTVEYVPIGVMLMALYELDRGTPAVLHAAGIGLIACRVVFAAGTWNNDAPNRLRATGITLTWIIIAALAGLNLWQIS
jgi:uncharacterized membrane protein YecN with MAPEG domain